MILSFGLLFAVAASIWAVRQPQADTVAAVSRPLKTDQRPALAEMPTAESGQVARLSNSRFEPLVTLNARRIGDEGVDLFQVLVPVVQKVMPTAAVTAPPPKPTTPPIPWKFAGRFVEGNDSYILLSSPNMDVSVKKGDVIDGQYRIDDIQATMILVTFLPMNEQQRIAISDGGFLPAMPSLSASIPPPTPLKQ
jgi:hypothetical protein